MAVGAAVAPWMLAEEKKKKVPVGVQLYSVRNLLKEDFTGTIEKLGKIGYQGVEFAGYYLWDKKPKELRKLLDDNGLKCCGTHTPLITLQGDALKSTVELHQTLGNKYLICPSMNGKDVAGWERLAKQFSEIAAKLKEQGMVTGYHAHAGDFKKLDNGKTAWETFFDAASPDVVHQIDTGNTLDGGGDPLAMIKKYPGRTKSSHIKEHGGPAAAAIGEGEIDWPAYFAAYESVGGIEWYIVEHEKGDMPMESVRKCLEGMHRFGR